MEEERLALTPAQLAIWKHLIVHPQKADLYHFGNYLEIEGDVDLAALAQALRDVVATTASLRVQCVQGKQGQVWQSIRDRVPEDGPIVDFSSETDARTLALEWMLAEQRKTFAVTAFPLCRMRIMRVTATVTYVFVHAHHLVIDGYGIFLLRERIAAAYRNVTGTRATRSDEVQFRDYVKQSLDYRGSARWMEDRAYWSRFPREAHAVSLSLAPERRSVPREAISSGMIEIARSTTGALSALAPRIGMRMNPMLIGLVLLYLYQATRAPHISFGLPVHGRSGSIPRDFIATCAGVLPVPIAFDREARVEDFMQSVAARIADALTHSQFQYEDIRGAVDAKHHDRNLFNVVINVLPTSPDLDFAGARGAPRGFTPGYVDDLAIWLFVSTGHSYAKLKIDGHPDRYHAWELQQHAANLLALFETFAERWQPALPLTRVLEIDTAASAHSKQQAKWADGVVPELFSERARATPYAIAIKSGRQRWTYAELECRANELARCLQAKGIGRDDIVGVVVDRSPEMLLGMLGIMKAGAAYLPLDLEHPAERLEFMLQDAQVRIVVARAREPTGAFGGAQHWIVIEEEQALACYDVESPTLRIAPDDLAYCIYTSGSTGQPKGVAVTQRNLLNHNAAMIEEFGLHAEDRVLQFASCSFDASVEEIFPTWLAGATLVLSRERRIGVAELLTILVTEAITVLNLPTAYWAAWTVELARSSIALPPRLRLVIIGGEKATLEAARRWRDISGSKNVRCLNTYGPTEATVSATVFELGDAQLETYSVPIGRAIRGVSLSVVDDHLGPVPVGAVGELCIGGQGVARGYINDPELTAERFVADADAPGSRVYRTGDSVRALPDGNFEYVGRGDDQVKVRGFRIHLREVEAALRRCADVQECVVTSSGEPARLSAFVKPSSSDHDGVRERLQDTLRHVLPPYMLPAVYVFVHELPLTVNGKVDRKALAALAKDAKAETGARRGDDVGLGPTEQKLAAMWIELLNVARVRRDDNFLDLGGDSLLAVSLVSEIARREGIEISLRTVFQFPTLGALAERLDRLAAGEVDDDPEEELGDLLEI